MRLSFSRQRSRVQVDLKDRLGFLKVRASSKLSSTNDFRQLALDLGIDLSLLCLAIDQFERGINEFDIPEEDKKVFIRALLSSESITFCGSTMLEAFLHALGAVNLDIYEPIIFWKSCDELAALDLDSAEGYEWTDEKLLSLEGIPTPVASWITKDNGLRLIYINQDPFTAEEIAAVAYLCLVQQTPYKSIEIKKDTRHPAYQTNDGVCGPVYKRQQNFDPSHLRRWLRMFSATDAEAGAWLEEHGMILGGRYDHSKCPVDSGHISHGVPILVGDHGVQCFSCEARGIVAGSTKPGFFPYAYLCGTSSSSMVYKCMEAAVHWEHAKYIIESKLNIHGRYASLLYSAGLLLHSWPRELSRRVFDVGKNLIRMGDRWTNLNGETYKEVKPVLATLPACCTIKEGKFLQDKAKQTIFDQTHDLTQYGYPSVQPIYGIKIFGHYLEERILSAIIQTRVLSDESMVKFRPIYRQTNKEMVNDAWFHLEKVFPRLNRNYIKLLIAAKGVIEGDVGMPPMIFVEGPTGSGKSISIHLAASICGDINTEPVWTSNMERLRQAIVDARGSFVTFNEPFKEAKRQTKESALALDFALNLTPDSVSHYMYTGPVRLGRMPVIIWTDTKLPDKIRQDAQLARRIICVSLFEELDWEDRLKSEGISHPKFFRVSSEANAEACNIIVSSVIDEFFQRVITFEDIAKKLGFNRIKHSMEAEESRSILRLFFDAVCNSPSESNGIFRLNGNGWKIIRREIESDLRNIWVEICDDDFVSSRRCTEVDWRRLLNAHDTVFFECRHQGGNKVAVRFRCGTKINKEIL